jgi:hypothetical protein
MTSGINHCRGGDLLMPTASQVSTFDMGITSASTQSQFMIERSHKPNMTNINHVSMNEQQQSGYVSWIRKNHVSFLVLQNGWTPLAKLEAHLIPWMKDFGRMSMDWTQF